jgi:hypothetical protein
MVLCSKQRATDRPSITLHHEASLRTPSPHPSTIQELCVRGWWRDRLVNTPEALNAQLPSFPSHLESLRIAQKRMHILARKCTQARLYPNPASTNSKPLLKAQISALEADLDFYARLNDMYSAALSMYTLPVQAIIDNLQHLRQGASLHRLQSSTRALEGRHAYRDTNGSGGSWEQAQGD